jgi:putative ABC transport system substrate-binding protein
MRRRQFITLLGGAAAIYPLAARAQRAMPVIGWLGSSNADEFAGFLTAFRLGLADTGFVEGRDVTIEYRWADQRLDRLPGLAAELVDRRVSVIFCSGGQVPPLAAKAATSTIPIVFALGSDPVRARLVDSIGRPGGNVTGVSFLATGLMGKQLAILRELLPKAVVVAALVNPDSLDAEIMTRDMQDAARVLGFEVQVQHVTSDRELNSTFEKLAAKRPDAMLMGANQLFLSAHHQLILLSARHGIPALFEQRVSALAGGLISYGPNANDAYRQAGIYVGRILKGAKPSELPVLLPAKYDMVINLKTAKTLGLDVPWFLQQRAEEVIE